MADFRKWLIAFALVAILLGLSIPASAVTLSAPITCNVTASPKQVRAEGVTELVGDIILTCTGGTPTTPGQPIALNNIRVGLGVPLTSRIIDTGTNASEAVLMIDEPFPTTPFPAPPNSQQVNGSPSGQWGCLANGVPGNKCEIHAVAGIVVGGVLQPPQPYNGQFNTFQGVTTTVGNNNYIDFLGVPFDPPGTAAERVIRITNIRADMNHSGGLPVSANVTISGNGNLTSQVANTQVATSFPGFQAGGVKNATIVNCTGGTGSGASVTFQEGFATAFLTKQMTNADQSLSWRDDSGIYGGGGAATTFEPQNVPGLNYFTESGFTPTLENFGSTSMKGATDTGGAVPANGSIGVADYGTRFLIQVSNLQAGVSLGFSAATGSGHLLLYLVKGANSDGTGGTVNAANSMTLVGSAQPGIAVGVVVGPTTPAPLYVVYEVVSEDPNSVESVTITPTVTYTAKPGSNLPALTANSAPSEALASASFAPLTLDNKGNSIDTPYPLPAGVPNSTSQGSIPRFVVTPSPPTQIVLVNPCQCNLLYPWVVNDGQFDTGLAVVNTSADPYSGAHAQSGTVQFWFYGAQNGVTPVPAVVQLPATGSIVVPSGCAYVMVLSQGGIGLNTCANGSTGTSANSTITQAQTQMFTGYIIVQTTFQYCHGVAYINEPASAAIGSFYEAIQLDEPFNLLHTETSADSRTGNWGENDGH